MTDGEIRNWLASAFRKSKAVNPWPGPGAMWSVCVGARGPEWRYGCGGGEPPTLAGDDLAAATRALFAIPLPGEEQPHDDQFPPSPAPSDRPREEATTATQTPPVVAPSVPVPTVPAAIDDFDEHTPPPRTRPRGEPIGRYVRLPPGESAVGWFAAMYAQGRVPVGSFLADHVGSCWGQAPNKSGYTVAAQPGDHGTKGGHKAPCAVGKPLLVDDLESYVIRAVVRERQMTLAVFSPKES